MERKKILGIISNPAVSFIIYSPLVDYHQWALLGFVKRNAKSVKRGERIIDIGAGELKYKKYFAHCEYVSQDLGVGDSAWDFSGIDIKSSAYEIPEKDASFDYVLCMQVLEHLEFPERAFSEFGRLLKRGGRLLISAPLGFGEHQIPYDYFRYTRYALRGMGERHGFRLMQIEPHGGIFINLEYMLWQSIGKLLPFNRLTPIRYFYFFLLLPLKAFSGAIFITLDIFDRKKDWTLNYNCVYEKVA
jgi:SAM-dependent methyltransferase